MRRIPAAERRIETSITLSPNSKDILEKVSKGLGMSQSRFIEFMLMTMERSEDLSMSDFLKTTVVDIIKAQRNED